MKIDSSGLLTSIRSVGQQDDTRALAQLREGHRRIDLTTISPAGSVQSTARLSVDEALEMGEAAESTERVVELPILTGVAEHADSVTVDHDLTFSAGNHTYQPADEGLEVADVELPEYAIEFSSTAGELVMLVEQVGAPQVTIESSDGDLHLTPHNSPSTRSTCRGSVRVPADHATVGIDVETILNRDYLTRCLRSLPHGSETTVFVPHEHPVTIVSSISSSLEIWHTIAPRIRYGGDDE